MKTKVAKQGICPQCESDDLEYGASEPKDDSIYYPYTCQYCDFDGEEVYSLVFCGHINNNTGNMIDAI